MKQYCLFENIEIVKLVVQNAHRAHLPGRFEVISLFALSNSSVPFPIEVPRPPPPLPAN